MIDTGEGFGVQRMDCERCTAAPRFSPTLFYRVSAATFQSLIASNLGHKRLYVRPADGTMVEYGGEGTCMTQIFDRITVNPRQCGGRPCVRGMRIRVSDVLELLAEGMTPEQILEEHPDLELQDIHACLRFASQRVSNPILAA